MKAGTFFVSPGPSVPTAHSMDAPDACCKPGGNWALSFTFASGVISRLATWIWIVIAMVAALAVGIAVFGILREKRLVRNRQRASRLREEAERHGLTTNDYAARLIEQNLLGHPANAGSLWNTLTPEEWIRVATEWAEGHDRSIAPLSDEAVSRESFYEGRP